MRRTVKAIRLMHFLRNAFLFSGFHVFRYLLHVTHCVHVAVANADILLGVVVAGGNDCFPGKRGKKEILSVLGKSMQNSLNQLTVYTDKYILLDKSNSRKKGCHDA
jgi:hypothetical protein